MTKLVGIRIIAIGSFLVAAFSAIMGTRPMLALIYQQVKNSNDGSSDGLAAIGALLILIGLIFPILYGVAGWGLWKLKNWARVLAIILNAQAAAFELLRWLLAHHLGMSYFISIGLSAVIIFYLLRPSVVSAFSRGSVGERRLDQLA